MAQVLCPVCHNGFESAEVEEHLAESHSDPNEMVAGVQAADFIRNRLQGGAENVPLPVDAETTSAPSRGPLEELGVTMGEFATVIPSTMAGASLTPTEAKEVMVAVEDHVKFRVNRGAFLVDFIDWGILNGFSEELKDSGGFTIKSHATITTQQLYVRVDNLQAAVEDYFAEKGYNRGFTFRRFGRYLGKSIPTIMAKNPSLSRYFVDGTPMSNRLGVKAQNCLAVTSIFEYIKPYSKWSSDELSAWTVHNRSVVKQARSDNVVFMPTDLRPSPSQAETLIDRGQNDFATRHSNQSTGYGIGTSIFEKMLKGTRAAGDKRGVGGDS